MPAGVYDPGVRQHELMSPIWAKLSGILSMKKGRFVVRWTRARSRYSSPRSFNPRRPDCEGIRVGSLQVRRKRRVCLPGPVLHDTAGADAADKIRQHPQLHRAFDLRVSG